MSTELSVHVSYSSEAEVPAIGRSEQLSCDFTLREPI